MPHEYRLTHSHPDPAGEVAGTCADIVAGGAARPTRPWPPRCGSGPGLTCSPSRRPRRAGAWRCSRRWARAFPWSPPTCPSSASRGGRAVHLGCLRRRASGHLRSRAV